MTRFQEKRFTGPSGTARPDECRRVGHTQPDYHGRCYRCGVRVETPSQAMRDRAAEDGATIVEGRATLAISQEAIDACQPRRDAFVSRGIARRASLECGECRKATDAVVLVRRPVSVDGYLRLGERPPREEAEVCSECYERLAARAAVTPPPFFPTAVTTASLQRYDWRDGDVHRLPAE